MKRVGSHHLDATAEDGTTNIATVEFATVGKDKSGKVYHHLWSGEEIDALLRRHDLAKGGSSDD